MFFWGNSMMLPTLLISTFIIADFVINIAMNAINESCISLYHPACLVFATAVTFIMFYFT